MFCIKSVNEASENDFAGKDTIIVVSAVTGKRVEKTSAQKARDARNPNAFGDDYVVRPMGAEIYYLVDSATADDLTSTDLFYSSVRPESDQLFFKIKNLSPVIVHTTGTRGSRSTNFGYRESNDFIDNCLTLKQVMEGAFGAKNVRVFNFKTSHNDRLRFCEYRDDGKAVEDWGMWYEATDLSKFESGAGKKLVRAVSKSWREVTPQLKHDPILRPASELDEFFANLKPMKLSLAEDEAALCKMKDDFVEEGFEQTEFDFSYNKKNDELEWRPVFDAIRAAEQGLRPTKFQFVNSQPSLISAPAGADVVAEYFHDGELMIAARFRMSDPLDSEFYEEHHPLLGTIAGNMPKGFVAEFADTDVDGSNRKFIGTKEVLSKDVSRYSGPDGVETSDMYDVVETLVIHRAGDVTEDDNPDDAKTDDIFIKGDKYEAALKAGQQAADDFIEVDFPAWALDYAVNAELGSVSRVEKFAVDKWFEMMDREGYDVSLISYGEDEYFSSDPEFGMPGDCVKAKLPKKVISEGTRPDYSGNAHKNIDPVAKYLDMFV